MLCVEAATVVGIDKGLLGLAKSFWNLNADACATPEYVCCFWASYLSSEVIWRGPWLVGTEAS
jgi:hypothetical protein